MTKHKFEAIDTPATLIREAILVRNITDMSQFARQIGINLRPHIKTHKIPRLARIQVNQGAVGIAVSKIDEAKAMIDGGIKDVLIADPFIGQGKISRVLKLSERAEITVTADSPEGIKVLGRGARDKGETLKVLLAVDCGFKGFGILPGEDVFTLARSVQEEEGLEFAGLMTHAGHSQGAKNPEQVQEIGKKEGQVLAQLAESLKNNGLSCPRVSAGSTPTAKVAGMVKGVTEIRPGNYVFNDLAQVSLGVAMEEDCALTVLTRVVSRPAADRCVIDAGSKTLSLDRGATGETVFSGFGKVKGHPEVVVSRLEEEHAILSIPPESEIKIGDLIEIIPNHAGQVMNLAGTVHVIRNEEPWEEWEISAVGSK